MKKFISVFLAISTVFSCASFSVAAVNQNNLYDFSIFSEEEMQLYEEQ